MDNSNYWKDFWINRGKTSKDKDMQSQVLRTSNKKPIDENAWNSIVSKVITDIELKADDTVLDLCSGNGLFAISFAGRCKSVTAVDISQDLLNNETILNTKNIQAIVNDVRDLKFGNNSFDKVAIYAGVQYLSHSETIKLIKKIHAWLKEDGILFIGDIPDLSRLWNFYNTAEREAVFFDNLMNSHDIIGTWFNADFFQKLSDYIGFKTCEKIDQDPGMLHSHFRYNFKFIK